MSLKLKDVSNAEVLEEFESRIRKAREEALKGVTQVKIPGPRPCNGTMTHVPPGFRNLCFLCPDSLECQMKEYRRTLGVEKRYLHYHSK